MPALTIPSPTNTRSTSPADSATPLEEPRHDRPRSRSQSPDRPPISPLTPTATAAKLVLPEPPELRTHVLPPPAATFIQRPPALPISESENPDAIALRSAISLLQLQREKSKRDIKTLQDLKSAAISDPEGFARSVQAQAKQSSKAQPDVLSATLLEDDGPVLDGDEGIASGKPGERRKDSAGGSGATSKFPTIPQPQNIVRCPPVNWAKYHIVGEPLDKMHEEQRRYPGSSEPSRTQQGVKAPPHAVAAPYSPFADGMSDPRTASSQRGTKTAKKLS
ncbi:hypothetical protein K491DRAFT_584474 [Lophiostoma macrostomum CBS 122681]|uniref:Uncharacterized protein n=1 Tax=Lophiostoma macrostomum CBS 122681 TaxID=1314788 RepID=A0A6A6TVP1_9PLEO|nr:hypothetical protein K491DRAFT_584474 [Lophiostoma macrostomum CBS 122681]